MLFADVVHSMDIAAVVGAERLREIMAELADRCATVLHEVADTTIKPRSRTVRISGSPALCSDTIRRSEII